MRLQSADEGIKVRDEGGRDEVRVQLQWVVIAGIALCIAIISLYSGEVDVAEVPLRRYTTRGIRRVRRLSSCRPLPVKSLRRLYPTTRYDLDHTGTCGRRGWQQAMAPARWR